MPALRLRLFGTFDARYDDRPLPFRSDKIRGLLAYLVVEANRPQLRPALAALFWGELPDAAALTNLRMSLMRLRDTLGPLDPALLTITRQTVQFNLAPAGDIEVDVLAFDQLLDECDRHPHPNIGRCPDCVARLEQAAELYAGDFLAGFTLGDSPAFDDWRLWQETTRHQKMVQALQTLIAQTLTHHADERCQHYARRQIALEPWREEGHRALMLALAHSGQINAALKQYELCRETLRTELNVEPSAELQLLAEQLRSGTYDDRPETDLNNNLRRQVTPLIGREAELAQLRTRLSDPAHALITVIGPGGIGKTRLAIAAAEEQIDLWPDGVWFVSLAEVGVERDTPPDTQQRDVAVAIARALQLSLDGRAEPKTQLLNHLRRRRQLLILDNFEHLLDSVDLVPAMLQAAPQVKILATSRERLNLRAESILRLGGLPVPPPSADPQAITYGSVRLFLEGAQRLGVELVVTAQTLQDIVKICRLVDGLPLAIELAATWTQALTCGDIAREIARNLDMLSTRQRDVPERQRSVRAIFEYARNRLAAAEQPVFDRLAVFRGGFRLEAAAAIADASAAQLASLVDQSLLRALPAGRYDYHPLIQQYAEKQLSAGPAEHASALARHGHYFANFVQQRTADLKGARQQSALSEIDEEIENIRAAWQWAVAQHDIGALARSLEGLGLYYDIRGWYQIGEAEFAQAAAMLRQVGDGDKCERALTLGRMLMRQALCYFWQSRFDEAEAVLHDSLRLLRPLDDRRALAETLHYLGMSHQRRGAYQPARVYGEESLSIYRALRDRWGEAAVLHLLGTLARVQGDYDQSCGYHQAAVTLFRTIGEPRATANALNDLGYVYRLLGRPLDAIPLLKEGAVIARDIGYKVGAAFAIGNLGSVAYALGQYHEAQQCFDETISLFRDLSSQREIEVGLIHLGNVDCAVGDHVAARRHFFEALSTSAQRRDEPIVLRALVGIARLQVETGRLQRTAWLLQSVLHHPVLEQEYRDRAEHLLKQLVIEPAESAGEAGSLEDVAAEVLNNG